MNKIKEILRIGIPIMLGQACVIILAFADNIMIGWHGVNELAASSFVNSVMNFFILTELGFASGMTPIIGAFHGTGNVKGVGVSLRNGMMVNGIIGIIGLVLLSIIYVFIDKTGQAPELLRSSVRTLSLSEYPRFSRLDSMSSSSSLTESASRKCQCCSSWPATSSIYSATGF